MAFNNKLKELKNMSYDLNIYLKNISDVDKNTCISYLSKFGMDVDIYPEVDFNTHTGFLPFKFKLHNPPKYIEDMTYLSGFEYYADIFNYNNEIETISQEDSYLFDAEFDYLIKECAYVINLYISAQDSFEVRFAFLFGAYLVDCCGGIFIDNQSGLMLAKNASETLFPLVLEYESAINVQTIKTHFFEAWS